MRTISLTATLAARAAGSASSALGRCLVRCLDAVYGWQVRSEERTHLARLDDRLLRDIGLTRLDVDRESSKPFWKA